MDKFNQTFMQVAALTFDVAQAGALPTEIQLLPAGDFAPTDGRKLPVNKLRLTQANAEAVIAKAAARQNDFVLDYEHQTLLATENGQPAPAAGWFSKLEFRPGKGLYATDVRWTDRAAAYLTGGEYKYISAVFTFDERTGDVQRLLHAGLTNNPALDGMEPVLLAASQLMGSFEGATALPSQNSGKFSEDVDMDSLRALLGLPASADAVAVEKAVAALKEKSESAGAEVVALKAVSDPAKYVPVEQVAELQLQVAALTAAQHERAVEEVIVAAKAEGKILPTMEEWARSLGKQDLAQLKAYVEKAPAVAALSGNLQTGGKSPGQGQESSESLTATQIALKAQEYVAQQAALGIEVNSAQAVEHVLAARA